MSRDEASFFRAVCDEPGCDAESEYVDYEQALADGWVRYEGDFFCPACWGEGL